MFEDCIAMLGNLHNGACAKCQSDDDLFAGEVKVNLVNGFNSSLPGGKTKAVYETQAEAKTHSCSYTCNTDKGYFFFPATNDRGNRCAECAEGEVYTGNDGIPRCRVEKITDCSYLGDGYILQDGECLPLGYCKNRKGNEVKNIPDGALGVAFDNNGKFQKYELRNINDFIPILSNKEWSCYNDPYRVSKNKCSFTCNESQACEYDDSLGIKICKDLKCNPSHYEYHQVENARGKLENPTRGSLSNYARTNNTSSRVDRTFIEADSLENFYNQVNNKEGCYFWCPSEYEYGEKCYKTIEERNQAEENDNNYVDPRPKTYSCEGELTTLLYGYSKRKSSSSLPNTNWESFATIGGYENNLNRGCVEGCTNETTKVITGSKYFKGRTHNGKPVDYAVCRKRCKQDEIFHYATNGGGGCYRCSDPETRPDPNKENWIDDNPIKCVEKCPGGVYCPNCGENGDWSCKYSEIPKDSCEERGGFWLEGECVITPIVYAPAYMPDD